jgi:hypothetical protein
LGFWPRSFVQICAKSRQTCLGADYTWLTQLNKVFIFNKHLGCYMAVYPMAQNGTEER